MIFPLIKKKAKKDCLKNPNNSLPEQQIKPDTPCSAAALTGTLQTKYL